MKVFDKECDLMNVISGAAYNNPRWLGVVPMYQYIYVTAIFMRFIAARLFTESNSGSEDTEAITEGFCHAFRPDLIALHVNPLLDRFKKDGGEDWNRIVSPAFPRFDSPVEFPRKEPGWSHNILPEEYVLRGLPIALERPLPEKELRESSRAKVGDEEPPKINPEDATRCLPGLNFERQETPLPEGPKPWIATREETRKGVYFPEDYFSNDDGERDRQNLDTLDMSRERWVKTCWIVYRLATSGHWWTWSEDECQVTPVHSEPAADGGSLAEALRQLSETEGSKAAASADRGDVRPAALSDSASWSTVSRVSAEGSGGWDDCSIVESEAGGSVPPLKGYSSLSKAALPWRDDVQVRSVGPQEGEKEPARTSGKKTCGDDTGSDGSLASSYEMI
ncbi:hypothetical protein BDY21DRAFT_157415 [Lineolata rhizophorae]|uniref:Uncharacterized protein n=1 Tax=Lineolata rhizophorae TaxID=578093 RepID=A0A6A6NMS3_9PEZI|nr:hypothetical protein BDY21DRAFT_157415 [Lineolata rhizophorae]